MNDAIPEGSPSTLRIGTRKSPLAMWQAEHIRDRLQAAWRGLVVELVGIETKGDKILDVALSRVGGKGLFVKELEQALLDGAVDLCVHSTKDVPAALPDGTEIVAWPSRADARDCFADPRGVGGRGGVRALPHGARIGTSSLRRQAQLLSLRPDLDIVSVRGNVATRLRKVEELSLCCVVLAAAGLDRLAHNDVITHRLEPDEMLPAAGQGILAIQARSADAGVNALLRVLDDDDARTVVRAERAFLAALGGGCQVPIGAHALLRDDVLTLHGLVARPDGRVVVRATASRRVRGVVDGKVVDRQYGAHEAARLGRALAHDVLERGAARILTDVGVELEGDVTIAAPGAGGALAGMQVIVARDDAPDDALSKACARAGAVVEPLRLMELAAPSDGGAALERAVRNLHDYDVVAFTSRHAVERFASRLQSAGLDLRALRHDALVASVGPTTSASLRAHGFVVDVEGDEGAVALAHALGAARSLSGARVLFARSEGGRDELVHALQARGAVVDVVAAYRSVELPDAAAAARAALLVPFVGRRVVVVTSPARVHSLVRTGVAVEALTVVAIGETTAQAVRDAQWPAPIVLPSPTADALVACLSSLSMTLSSSSMTLSSSSL